MVALTHMRTDNDVRLAEKVPEIDLILGGHNLVYEKRKVGRKIRSVAEISIPSSEGERDLHSEKWIGFPTIFHDQSGLQREPSGCGDRLCGGQ